MANMILPAECLQASESARSWAFALDWRQREAELRELLSNITQKGNRLHTWEAQRRQKDILKEQHKHGRFQNLRPNNALLTSTDIEQWIVERGPPSKFVVPRNTMKEELFDKARKAQNEELNSVSGRTQSAADTIREEVQPHNSLCSGTSITSASPATGTAASGIRIAATTLRNQIATIRSYPLYHDSELGLEDLGYAMDVEMAAVPNNCREDDDVQTTSDVLALGVDTVERYLSSCLLLADKYIDPSVEQRLEKLRERILKP